MRLTSMKGAKRVLRRKGEEEMGALLGVLVLLDKVLLRFSRRQWKTSMGRVWPRRDDACSQPCPVVSDLVVRGQVLRVDERQQNMIGSR